MDIKTEEIYGLEEEVRTLHEALEAKEAELQELVNQLDIQPSFASAEEQEGHFTLTEDVAERRRERDIKALTNEPEESKEE